MNLLIFIGFILLTISLGKVALARQVDYWLAILLSSGILCLFIALNNILK